MLRIAIARIVRVDRSLVSTFIALLPVVLVVLASSLAAQMPEWEHAPDGSRRWKDVTKLDCETCKGHKRLPCVICALSESKKCVFCKSTKKMTCRVCDKKGRRLDPLVHQSCTQCRGIGVTVCAMCVGLGEIQVEGGGDRNRCFCCGASGGWKCSLCKGRGTIAAWTKKKSLVKADKKALDKLDEGLTQALKIVRVFAYHWSTPDAKMAKAYASHMGKVKKTLPEAAVQAKGLRQIVKNMARAQRFQLHKKRMMGLFDAHKKGVLDLIERRQQLIQQVRWFRRANERANPADKPKK